MLNTITEKIKHLRENENYYLSNIQHQQLLEWPSTAPSKFYLSFHVTYCSLPQAVFLAEVRNILFTIIFTEHSLTALYM